MESKAAECESRQIPEQENVGIQGDLPCINAENVQSPAQRCAEHRQSPGKRSAEHRQSPGKRGAEKEQSFRIRRANPCDLDGIMQVMNEAKENPEHPDWFVPDNEDYIREHINAHGFTVVSEAPDGQIAGFFVVKYPESMDHLGKYLHYTEEELEETAIMDSAAVAAAYRGHHLQRRMLQAAEADIDRTRCHRLLCTVHPENVYSLHNMQSQGYEVRTEVSCYGGRRRYVLEKRLDG